MFQETAHLHLFCIWDIKRGRKEAENLLTGDGLNHSVTLHNTRVSLEKTNVVKHDRFIWILGGNKVMMS